jgi:hypothetical protein
MPSVEDILKRVRLAAEKEMERRQLERVSAQTMILDGLSFFERWRAFETKEEFAELLSTMTLGELVIIHANLYQLHTTVANLEESVFQKAISRASLEVKLQKDLDRKAGH